MSAFQGIAYRCAAATLGLMLISMAALPREAAAQRSGKQRFFSIHVTKIQNICRYEIEDYDNQDLFVIEPHGVVDFRATGTRALIQIQKNNTGVGGVVVGRGNSLFLEDGDVPQNLRARAARGSSSRHDVNITCCVEADCSQKAVPVIPDGGGGGDGSGPSFEDTSTPAAAVEDLNTLGEGGPTMEVDP